MPSTIPNNKKNTKALISQWRALIPSESYDLVKSAAALVSFQATKKAIAAIIAKRMVSIKLSPVIGQILLIKSNISFIIN